MLKRKWSAVKDSALELYLSLKEIDEMPFRLIQGDFSDRKSTIERYKKERRLKLVPPPEKASDQEK